jgi:23S rRNA pseudouridine1911/1915/1917 synthase
MTQNIKLKGEILLHQSGQRLDQALAEIFPTYSRARLKTWVTQGYVQVNQHIVTKARTKVLAEQTIEIDAWIEEVVTHQPEPMSLNIVYEDEHLLVINKPQGLVVHPGAGNQQGTLLNALLHHAPELENIPRAGIVHRLDKDTTGLMVVAKTLAAQTSLTNALQARQITREYEAVVIGSLTSGGHVNQPLGRHPSKRTHMAIVPQGKEAITHYRIAEKFRAHTRLRLRLETGRTHQIRVHMAHLNHPLVGDQTYGRPRPIKDATAELSQFLLLFKRQALHAALLSLTHPVTEEIMTWQAPIPEDMQSLTMLLRLDTQAYQG